jgi:RsiW-degrading membrane proteinase PrsW (M82 family)
MAVLILLIFALVFSGVLALRIDPPQINLRWAVVACLIGAMLAGMPVPGLR